MTGLQRAACAPVAAGGALPALNLVEVSRRYGATVALAPLTLRMLPGSVGLVTGVNGSGKTTLLRLAAGVATPSAGTRSCAGPALYLAPGDGVRAAQTPREAVDFAAALRDRPVAVAEALRAAGLGAFADTPARALSAGQRARVTLAVALASQPALACLDEPTAHLDEEGRAVAAEVVRRLAAVGAAVLIASHDSDLLGDMADVRLTLRAGRLVAAT